MWTQKTSFILSDEVAIERPDEFRVEGLAWTASYVFKRSGVEYMIRILHLADTHIRNLQYHDVYRDVFKQIEEYINHSKDRIDVIVHAGDLFHHKTNCSPEYFRLASDFLEMLAQFAPTIIIPGNHDKSFNKNREDAISPIARALNLNNLHMLADNQNMCIHLPGKNHLLNIAHLPYWIPKEEWSSPEKGPENWINIGLYHGPINNAKTDLDFKITSGIDVQTFDEWDFVLTGDIHLANQPMDPEGRIRYCGSTIQQGFGEKDDKGFLIWEIEDRNEFSVEHVVIPNPKPFVTITLDDHGNENEPLSLKNGSRVRILRPAHVPYSCSSDVAGRVRKACTVESVVHATFPAKEKSDSLLNESNIDEVFNQSKMIENFLRAKKASEDEITAVLRLNEQFNSEIQADDDVLRNVRWSLREMRWNNMFSYGEGNSIDFSKLNGLVGLLGPGGQGKSAVIDSLQFGLFNTIDKNARKSVNLINDERNEASVDLLLSIGQNEYLIKRKLSRNVKKTKGKEIEDAKTELDFRVDGKELIGDSRIDTDGQIRRIFGTSEDFQLTNIATQFGALDFIGKGSKDRKEILARFLDLSSYEKKHKVAKEYSKSIKSEIKTLEGMISDVDEAQLTELQRKIDVLMLEERAAEEYLNILRRDYSQKRAEISLLDQKIDTKLDLADALTLHERLKVKREELHIAKCSKELLPVHEKTAEEMREAIESFDYKKFSDQKAHEGFLRQKYKIQENQNEALEQKITEETKKLGFLCNIPCNNQFPDCKFISDANKANQSLPELRQNLEDGKRSLQDIKEEIQDFLKSRMSDDLFKSWTEDKRKYDRFVAQKLNPTREKAGRVDALIHECEKIQAKIDDIERNQGDLKNRKGLLNLCISIENQMMESNRNLKRIQAEIQKIDKEIIALQAKKEVNDEMKAKLKKALDAYRIYDLFLKAMHPNGITFDIVQSVLSFINEKIDEILHDIVPYSAFFEADDNRLDIFLKKDGQKPRLIELASGSEKTMISMAIRLALLQITSLPVADIFILDEPATSLDSEKMEAFIRLLDMIKSQFKTVLIISHLDILKDAVETVIEIKNDGTHAKVNV